jgi:hypothetical protein
MIREVLIYPSNQTKIDVSDNHVKPIGSSSNGSIGTNKHGVLVQVLLESREREE